MPKKGELLGEHAKVSDTFITVCMKKMYQELEKKNVGYMASKNNLLPKEVKLSQSTLTKLIKASKGEETSAIDIATIEKICQLTGKQPLDFLEGWTIDHDPALRAENFILQSEETPNESENK